MIESRRYVRRTGGHPRNLIREGQESNYGTVGMCKMNMVLRDVVDFKIEFGDVLGNPKLVEGGRLKIYDKVVANFPFHRIRITISLKAILAFLSPNLLPLVLKPFA